MRYPRESTKYKGMLLDITEIKNAKKLLIIVQKNIRKERKLLEREQSALNLAKNKAEKYKNEYKARIVKIKEQKDVYVKRKLEVSVEVRKLLTHKMALRRAIAKFEKRIERQCKFLKITVPDSLKSRKERIKDI